MKANQDVRAHFDSKGVRHWQVADKLLMSESLFSRKLRRELSEREKAIVIEAIDKVAAENEEAAT